MIDAYSRSRRQSDLTEGFRPDRPDSLVEEAQDWLSKQ
jgi:hypothetical protein